MAYRHEIPDELQELRQETARLLGSRTRRLRRRRRECAHDRASGGDTMAQSITPPAEIINAKRRRRIR